MLGLQLEAVALGVGKFRGQSFGGDERLRAKHHLRKESRRDHTGRGSVRESASTSASANRDAGLGLEATLMDRELHEDV